MRPGTVVFMVTIAAKATPMKMHDTSDWMPERSDALSRILYQIVPNIKFSVVSATTRPTISVVLRQ